MTDHAPNCICVICEQRDTIRRREQLGAKAALFDEMRNVLLLVPGYLDVLQRSLWHAPDDAAKRSIFELRDRVVAVLGLAKKITDVQ